jgi:hypothetical protein
MIVRISGEGQYELNDAVAQRLDELDTALTAALDDDQEKEFHNLLHATIRLVRDQGTAVRHDRVVPSTVIIPPEDTTLAEGHRFFTDEGFLQPVHA